MVQFSRRYAERQANMFVVCATTPAQVFHALRRQMNRCAKALMCAEVHDAPDAMLPHPEQLLCTSSRHNFGQGCWLHNSFSSCKRRNAVPFVRLRWLVRAMHAGHL